MTMKKAKLWIFIALVVALVALNYVFGWSDAVSGQGFVEGLEDTVQGRPVEAALLYVVLSIVGSVVLALPGVLFAFAAGVVFGPVVGTFLCWLSMTVGAGLSFLVGRYFLKDSLKPKLVKSKALNKLLFEGADRSDAFLLAITRLVPLFPYNLQNFAYGITDIRFAPYLFYSALFLFPGTAAYTVAAAGVIDEENRVACFVVAGVLFVLTIGIAFVLKKKTGVE